MNDRTSHLDYLLSMTGLKFYNPQTLLNILQNLDHLKDLNAHPTPSREIFSMDKMSVRHYEPYLSSQPALLIYALINALYILDLTHETSLISGLTEEGINVYAIDWGAPAGEDRFMDFEDYLDYIDEAVDKILSETGYETIDLILECQGGTLGLIYASLHPEKIRRIITLSTPVNFDVPSLSFQLAKNMDVDTFIDAMGLVPGIMMNSSFFLLYPFDALVGRYMELASRGGDADFLKEFYRIESWIYSGPKLVGQFLRRWLKNLCIDNELYRGVFTVYGEVVDLKEVRAPLLNVVGTKDNIAPPESSKELEALVDSEAFQTLVYDRDHITLITTEFTRDTLAKDIAKFLKNS